jgi:formylglycine-generating enzyme required for sulfatase activity
MVPLPPGSFMMGVSQKEKRQLKYVDWGLPQHQVSIGYPFAIGRFEITVDEFDAYVKETGAQVGGKCGIRTIESGPNKFKYTGTPVPGGDKTESAPYVIYIGDGSYAQPGLAVTGRQPAVCVSRNEMKDYLDWLSMKTNKHYRLPTEAEWEYAYRAGTDTFNYWGNDFKQTCDYANFADRKSGYQAGMAASCSEKIHPDWTAEVGSYKPNPWGLYDMGGNAQEAVEDCFHKSYQGAPADGSPWTEPDCVLFAARSGDYELTQFSMRAAERLIFGYTDDADDGMWTREEGSDERFNSMGFRVAVSLDDKSWDKMAGASAPEVKEAAVAPPKASDGGLQYDYLPRAVKSYVEEVRNSCRDYDPNGVPADRMSGIRPISLADGTPALLIENETLCSDHYSGANCSNRGCDVVVMVEGDNGWKDSFHEHLYDDSFDIGADGKLNSIAATIYAGDPHCDPDPNTKFESSDSCDVTIHYENKDWVWKQTR